MSRMPTLLAWLESHPDDRFARYAVALERRRAGDIDGAVDDLRVLLVRHPESGAGWLQLGQTLVDAGRDAEGIAAWRDGLSALRNRTEPEASKSRGEIAAALLAMGEDA